MSVDRSEVRALVRRELEKHVGKHFSGRSRGTHVHAALLEIYQGAECDVRPDASEPTPCIIEPNRPCTRSGYCKKLGY